MASRNTAPLSAPPSTLTASVDLTGADSDGHTQHQKAIDTCLARKLALMFCRAQHLRVVIGPAPTNLQTFERLVAKRIRAGHLDSMGPLRQAVHNSLARVVNLKAAKREHTNTRKRTRNHSRSSSNTSSFKLEEGPRLRRTRPAVRPLDVVAARAYDSAPPTDSPPESPGPTTPVEGSPLDSAGSVGIVVAGDEAMVLGERSRKGHVY